MSESEKEEKLAISNGVENGKKQGRLKFSKKVKKFVLFTFTNHSSKQQVTTRRKITHPVRRSSSVPVSVSCAAMSFTSESVGCYMCFRQPRTLDSPVDSRSTSSDPNSPNFSYHRFKALIEKNEFYDAECNTHIDILPPDSE